MRLPGSFLHWSIAVSALTFGCTPSIGDSCKLHTDCSATGDRLCEPNLPGGYCTISNCEQDSCPSEAACVAFGVAPSTNPECADTQQQRLERTYCMARCSSDGDCRTSSGYSCVDLGQPNVWGAAVVDTDRGTKICTVKPTAAAAAATKSFLASSSDQVCLPPVDASFPPVPSLPDASLGDATVGTRDGAGMSSNDGRAPLGDAGGTAPDARSGP